MIPLNNDWLTEGIFDFEYKKYVLLSYLQHVEQQFTSDRYFPHFNELRIHFQSCVGLRSSKEAIKTAFPKTLKAINIQEMKLEYEENDQDGQYLGELNYILDFAIPLFSTTLDRGAARIAEISENISISPVGIVPLRTDEGYLLFLNPREKVVSIFQYGVTFFNEFKERQIKTEFVDRERIGLGNTVSQLKVGLTKRNNQLPNPATYVVESKYDYPLEETLLPVTRKIMLQHLNIA